MKTLKKIDVAVSCLLLLTLLGIVIYRPRHLFTAYLLLGGWQLISMLVHVTGGWFMTAGSTRVFYHRCVAVTGVMMVLAEWFSPFLFIYFLLLVGAPVMALIYTHLCWQECRALRTRPLSLLTGKYN